MRYFRLDHAVDKQDDVTLHYAFCFRRAQHRLYRISIKMSCVPGGFCVHKDKMVTGMGSSNRCLRPILPGSTDKTWLWRAGSARCVVQLNDEVVAPSFSVKHARQALRLGQLPRHHYRVCAVSTNLEQALSQMVFFRVRMAPWVKHALTMMQRMWPGFEPRTFLQANLQEQWQLRPCPSCLVALALRPLIWCALPKCTHPSRNQSNLAHWL